jgi:hypothetical protein
MHLRFLLLFAGLFVITACDKIVKSGAGALLNGASVAGQWKVQDYDHITDTNAFANGQQALQLTDNSWSFNHLYCFFKDGKYAELADDFYHTGTYTATLTTLTLTPDGEPTQTARILRREGYYMDLLAQKDAQFMTLKLGRTEEAISEPTQDPYHPSQNLWRVPPSSPESPEQIKQRARQHLQNTLALLEAGKERSSSVWSWKYTPTCIHVLRGGVDVRHETQIDEGFYKCFFSREQAQQAVKILSDAFAKVPRKSTELDKWVENDINYIKAALAIL